MFESFRRAQRRPVQRVDIDLASVRDTLRYIESDLSRSADYEKLARQIRSALAEIDRLELRGADIAAPAFTSAEFLPARNT